MMQGARGLKEMVAELKAGEYDGVEASLGDVDRIAVSKRSSEKDKYEGAYVPGEHEEHLCAAMHIHRQTDANYQSRLRVFCTTRITCTNVISPATLTRAHHSLHALFFYDENQFF